jgi:hypothetical protein
MQLVVEIKAQVLKVLFKFTNSGKSGENTQCYTVYTKEVKRLILLHNLIGQLQGQAL